MVVLSMVENYTEISFAALVDSLCQSSIKIAPYPRNFDAHYGVKARTVILAN